MIIMIFFIILVYQISLWALNSLVIKHLRSSSIKEYTSY